MRMLGALRELGPRNLFCLRVKSRNHGKQSGRFDSAKLADIVGGALLFNLFTRGDRMSSLNGAWTYRSFRPVQNGSGPQDIVPWTPPGALKLTTDSSGNVVGTLTFGPGVELNVSGKVVAAANPIPEHVDLTGEGMGAVYGIRGYFVGDGDRLVGTVVAVKNDIAKQPNGTSGPFTTF